MRRAIQFASVVLAAAFAPSVRAEPVDPGAAMAAAAFYGSYMKLKPSGIPDAAQRTQMRALMSPALNDLLAAADAAEARYAQKTKKQVPPLVEGDLFTSLFEGASHFSVGRCDGDAQKAVCPVDFVYDDGRNSPQARWQDKVHLVRAAAGWLVDDIEYDGNWPFARRGRMSEGLRAVVGEADR
jgi:hypothetical protein